MRKNIVAGLLFCFIVIPTLTLSAGLVPCDGVDCQACHIALLGQNIIEWLITTMTFVIAIVFVVGGFQMVTSGGDPGAVSSARQKMTNAIIGLLIMLLAWLVVDTVLKMLVNEDKLNGLGRPWSEIQCVEQPTYAFLPEGQARPVVGDGTSKPLSLSANITGIQGKINATSAYRQALCQAAEAKGIGDQCDSLQAIMAIESAGNPNAQSPYAAGLMQVTPSTAKGMFPNELRGKTDKEIGDWLKVPENGIKAGVEYYAERYKKYNGDLKKIYASYNGGDGALSASRDCPGLQAWECEWDDPAHTIPDMADGKGFKETRNYVPNVNTVRCAIANIPEASCKI